MAEPAHLGSQLVLGVAQGKASHPHLFHDLGSGRVAVLADGHDRQAVFDAIRARRCYALTGPRIIVDLSLEGHPMGSEVDAAQLPSSPQLRLDLPIWVNRPSR